MTRLFATFAFFLLPAAAFVACGDDSGGNDLSSNADMTACQGGPVSGAADVHCGSTFVTVDAAECSVDAGATGAADYGQTMYGTLGYDDDCKYHVTYTVDPICENQGVTFTVTVMNAGDHSAVTGAKTRAEVFLDATHPAPNSGQTVTETSPGTYKVGPVKFDKPGQWTARFHFFETCTDSPTSPHGHAAFYLNVP